MNESLENMVRGKVQGYFTMHWAPACAVRNQCLQLYNTVP